MVSIVVPIYRVEKYLPQCIESILKQTYKDLEIILVDDGSDDNCGSIIDAYAEKDPRIKAYHKRNGGVSSARNFGIERATGRYIMFIDSDDFIDKQMIKIMLNDLENSNSDMAVCEYDLVTEKGEFSRLHTKKRGISLYTAEQALVQMYGRKNIGWSSWNKLYKRELFQNVRFPEETFGEDMGTLYKVYSHCDRIFYRREVLYHYRRRADSGSVIFNASHYMVPFKMCHQMSDYYKKNNIYGLQTAVGSYSAKHALLTYLMVYGSTENDELLSACLNTILKNRKYLLKAPFLRVHARLFMWLLCLTAGRAETSILNLAAMVFQKSGLADKRI